MDVLNWFQVCIHSLLYIEPISFNLALERILLLDKQKTWPCGKHKKVILDSWWLPGEYGMYAYVWDCFELKRNAVFWDISRYLETHIVQAAIRANLLLRYFWGKCPYFCDSLRSYHRTMNNNSTRATSISVPSWVSRIWRHDSLFRNAAQNAKILDIPGGHQDIYLFIYLFI